MPIHTVPSLGFGLGLRSPHYPYILEYKPKIDFFEIISENFMDTDGKPKRNLERIRELYPIVMHGVSLSIGTVDVLNSDYLKKLKALKKWLNPAWISDHLCWTGVAHKNTHDLLPVPYTDEALRHIITRIKQVQDYLECPITLENPSTYLEFKESHIAESEFIATMAHETGCHLLLDVNNVYVTCFNHRLDPQAYIDALPLDNIIQIHLSGHSHKGTHIVDTHDDYVCDDVWNLYKYVLHKANRVPNTMIEWDDKIPEFAILEAELNKAKVASQTMNKEFLQKTSSFPFFAKQKGRESYKAPKDSLPFLNFCIAKTQKNGNDEVLQNSLVKNLLQQSMGTTATPASNLQNTQIMVQTAIIAGDKYDSNPTNWIRSKPDFCAQKQLGIYINAYRYRLYDVVAVDYPVLKAYLGEGAFEALIGDFINHYQSDNFNIARLALKLPDFVRVSLPKDIFAHELCTLETRITYIADLPETTALTSEHLNGITPDGLMNIILYPRNALELLEFSYPINEYYQKIMDNQRPKKPRRKKTYLVVFRHDDSVWRMGLESQEYELLQELFKGIKIGDALEDLDESIAPKITHYFSRWIQGGILRAE